MRFDLDERTVTYKRNFTPPHWMQLALNGEKINAIKALRTQAGNGPEGAHMSLLQSKRIVESVTNGIDEWTV